jgi:hypothetical protein
MVEEWNTGVKAEKLLASNERFVSNPLFQYSIIPAPNGLFLTTAK